MAGSPLVIAVNSMATLVCNCISSLAISSSATCSSGFLHWRERFYKSTFRFLKPMTITRSFGFYVIGRISLDACVDLLAAGVSCRFVLIIASTCVSESCIFYRFYHRTSLCWTFERAVIICRLKIKLKDRVAIVWEMTLWQWWSDLYYYQYGILKVDSLVYDFSSAPTVMA